MHFLKSFTKVAFVSSLVFVASAAPVLADSTGVVKGDRVNIRSNASTSAEILTTLDDGQALSIQGVNGDFYQIAFNGNTSYIAKQFVALHKVEACVNDSGVNIRSNPSTNGDILGKAGKGDVYAVTDLQADWYVIDLNGSPAYIKKDFLSGELLAQFSPAPQLIELDPEPVPLAAPPAEVVAVNTQPAATFAVIQSNNGLRLRSNASKDADVITVLSYYTVADVIEPGPEWTKVDFNGNQGYLSTEFISLQNEYPTLVSKAQEIIAYGRQFLGTPYAWAGTNLKRGVDCSGFVYAVMKQFNIHIGRSSREMSTYGTKIDRANMIPGDLVFFDTTNARNRGYISHVGIYIGNGSFIHSSSSRRTWGVTISSLYDDYYSPRYVTARRVLK
jgi:cell wall-associated NlpC family hydrolase